MIFSTIQRFNNCIFLGYSWKWWHRIGLDVSVFIAERHCWRKCSDVLKSSYHQLSTLSWYVYVIGVEIVLYMLYEAILVINNVKKSLRLYSRHHELVGCHFLNWIEAVSKNEFKNLFHWFIQPMPTFWKIGIKR